MLLRSCITSGRGKELQIEAEVDPFTNQVLHSCAACVARALIHKLAFVVSNTMGRPGVNHRGKGSMISLAPILFHQRKCN